jgi:hypothetical protein
MKSFAIEERTQNENLEKNWKCWGGIKKRWNDGTRKKKVTRMLVEGKSFQLAAENIQVTGQN